MSNPEQFRAHASGLDALRARFDPVRAASRQIERDQAAFGSLCGWIFTGLGDRHARQDELIAYVEENLLLAADGLRRVADGKSDLRELTGGAGSGDDTCAPSASEILDSVRDAVGSRDWVETVLADAAPASNARAAGLNWAMTNLQPLRRMLDDLAGMPEVVASHAALWNTMAADLRHIGADLRSHLDQEPRRPETRAYLAMMSHNVEALSGLAEVSAAMALITKAAGDLILLAVDIVRGLLADLVARVVGWVTEPTVAPWSVTASRLATVVATTWHIHTYVTALVTSLSRLSAYVDG